MAKHKKGPPSKHSLHEGSSKSGRRSHSRLDDDTEEGEQQQDYKGMVTGKLDLNKLIDEGCTMLVFDCPPISFSETANNERSVALQYFQPETRR